MNTNLEQFSKADEIKFMSIEDVAKLLNKKTSTIRTDVHRKPESLPPRLKIPGSRTLLWLEQDVVRWINERRESSWKNPNGTYQKIIGDDK